MNVKAGMMYDVYMKFHRSRGFTIIELMVVLVISMMIMGGLSLTIRGFLAREKVVQAANELAASLNLARNTAIINQSLSGFSASLDYVAVTIDASGTVKAYAVNNASGLGSTFFVKEMDINNINVTPVAIGGLQFAASSGKLLSKNPSSYISSPLPAGQTMAVTISSPETSVTKTISVSAFGITSN